MVPVVPPQAESARPSHASPATQARCRSFRDLRPSIPVISSPANAIIGERGLLLFGTLLPASAVGVERGPMLNPPFNTPVVGVDAQSAAFVSIVICSATADALLTLADELLVTPVPTSTHRCASAELFDVA